MAITHLGDGRTRADAPGSAAEPPPQLGDCPSLLDVVTGGMVRQPADQAFRRLNFELLVIFQEVMATGQAGIAADNLGKTQSAVSHGLRRLSHIVGAQLFIRDRWILIPTARARAIAPVVDQVVASVLTLVAPNEGERI